ncbi:MAG: hypothetical protein ACHQPH_12120, partial [Reyranellales bacterium]
HAMLAEILALQKANAATSLSNPEDEKTTRHGEITAYQTLARSGTARIAADANELFLVSDDMGFRVFSRQYFGIASSWLQPILLMARDTSVLSRTNYAGFVSELVRAGQTFISLDAATLLECVVKSKFELTSDIAALIEAIGGPEGEVATNSGIAAAFLKGVESAASTFACNVLASAIYASLVRGRAPLQSSIVNLVQRQIAHARPLTVEHSIAWLRGHSVGYSSQWPDKID